MHFAGFFPRALRKRVTSAASECSTVLAATHQRLCIGRTLIRFCYHILSRHDSRGARLERGAGTRLTPDALPGAFTIAFPTRSCLLQTIRSHPSMSIERLRPRPIP